MGEGGGEEWLRHPLWEKSSNTCDGQIFPPHSHEVLSTPMVLGCLPPMGFLSVNLPSGLLKS